MNKLEFSIITPVFNKWELTKNSLLSLKKHSPNLEYEVIIIDNASSDETKTELEPFGKSMFGDKFKLFQLEENINFGPASNLGAKHAQADILFFLNNDTLFTPNWFAPLKESLNTEKDLGALGPLLLYENDTVQHLGATSSSHGLSHLYKDFPKDHPVVKKKRHLQFITAAALMMPKKVFFDAGGFYELYRNGFEDVDLCVTLNKMGKKLTCNSNSIIYHLESQSSNRHDHERYNSQLLTTRNHQNIYYDMYRHALKDGFKIEFSDLYSEHALLSDAENQDLQAGLVNLSNVERIDKLQELNTQHILWLEGKQLLADELEKFAHFDKAAIYRLNALSIFPNKEDAKKLLKLTSKITDSYKKVFEDTTIEILKKINNRQKDYPVLLNMLNHKISICEKFGDSFLIDYFLPLRNKILKKE